MEARNEGYQSLEDQMDNLLKSISKQRNRAIKEGENVLHIITLLPIKPSDRDYFVTIFKNKAFQANVDRSSIYFLNTSSTDIL